MKSVFIILALTLLGHHGEAQESFKVDLIEREPCFLSVVNVYASPPVYDEKIVYEYEAGYMHRLIVIMSGIYSSVYVDKLILDVEGGVSKRKWSRVIDLRQLYSHFSLSEETDHLEFVQWDGVDKFSFKMYKFDFEAQIVEDENVLEVLLLE